MHVDFHKISQPLKIGLFSASFTISICTLQTAKGYFDLKHTNGIVPLQIKILRFPLT